MNKKDGLEFLQQYDLPTIKLLGFEDVWNEPSLIDSGLSLRLANKNDGIDVMLPSKHNVTDMNDVLSFYQKYYRDYDILIHKTINPQIIGSISKYLLSDYDTIVIEIFKDFYERQKGVIKERVIITLLDKRIIKIDNQGIINKKILKEIMENIIDIPYDTFDLEFVYDNNLIFTDFYSKDFDISKKKIKD